MRIHIAGGHLLDPANRIDAEMDLFVADGKVVGVGHKPDGMQIDLRIAANRLVVCPGLVDLAAHFREPGTEHKASIISESRAAAKGGVTTVCHPPDTNPVVDTPAVAELIQQHAQAVGLTRIVTLGALTKGLAGNQLSAMAALKDAGCAGVTNMRQPVDSYLIMRRAMEYASTYDLTVFVYPEDPALRNNGCAHEGEVSTRLGLPGIPAAAETVSVASHLALVEQTGARVHFCRLSTGRAVQQIARARYDGLPVTADVAIHQLHLSEIDVADFNAQCHVEPPLRTLRDQEKLRQGVKQGTIGAICSDHQPHDADAKLQPFSDTASGISGIETLLPLGLRLVKDEVLSLSELIERLSVTPAKILNLDAGNLAIGKRADVCIFDPNAYWEVHPATLVSRGLNTPFLGWGLEGLARYTLCGGRVVYPPDGHGVSPELPQAK